MKKNLPFAMLAAATSLFAACDNPADRTASAAVTEAVEKKPQPEAGRGIRYAFLPSSAIEFVGSKVTGSHDGGFRSFTGHFTIVEGEPIGDDHRVVIEMDSIWSDSERLTGHLKNADFFDVEKFPTSTFEATGIEKTAETTYQLSGNFTLHGVTKNITFPVTVSREGESVGLDAEFDINRTDFDIVYSGKENDLIREEVVIRLKLRAAPAAAKEATPEV